MDWGKGWDQANGLVALADFKYDDSFAADVNQMLLFRGLKNLAGHLTRTSNNTAKFLTRYVYPHSVWMGHRVRFFP